MAKGVEGWEYFSYLTDPKLACSCCGQKGMIDDFMFQLDLARDLCGFPFILSSGFRCIEHNSRVSSTGPHGPHTTGLAVDVLCYGHRARRLLEVAALLDFAGIGIHQKGPKSGRFIHLDNCPADASMPRPWVWSY